MSQPAILEVPNVMLQKGGFLPTARLSYKTLGELNADRSNAVLVPSWYTGTNADTEAFMVGTNRALDPGKYFIILTDLLGNGLSSSPSNTPSPFERTRFPRITIHDNVRLQHQLITETLRNPAVAPRHRVVDGGLPNLPMGSTVSGHGRRRLPDRRFGPDRVVQQGVSYVAAPRTGARSCL